jgi:ribosomal protein L44E
MTTLLEQIKYWKREERVKKKAIHLQEELTVINSTKEELSKFVKPMKKVDLELVCQRLVFRNVKTKPFYV